MVNVIIPAAGKASRMKPITSMTSKSMIPLNGRPVISYIVDEILKNDSVGKIIIVQNNLRDIEEFIKTKYSHIIEKFVFTIQESPEGPLHAIKVGYDSLNDIESDVLVWLGDTLCLEENFIFDEDFIYVSHVDKDPSRWCLIRESDGILFDKPVTKSFTSIGTDLALIGIYFFKGSNFNNRLIEAMQENKKIDNEYQISSILELYKNIKIKITDQWYDTGELTTYYKTKAALISKSSRSFNTLKVDTELNIITKTGIDRNSINKIENEKTWYKVLNDVQKIFVPKILKSPHGILSMSWESSTSLSEIWLYESIDTENWNSILKKIINIVHEHFYDFIKITDKELDALNNMYQIKNSKRLQYLMDNHFLNHEEIEIVSNFFNESNKMLLEKPIFSNIIHGDLHLGNILFDQFIGSIIFVDPRGEFGEYVGSLGDPRYDMAKLFQSLYCDYDEILSGKYTYNQNEVKVIKTDNKEKILKYIELLLTDEYKYNIEEIKRLSIILLMTSVPFHEDNNILQKVIINHALNLIREF